MKSLFLPLVQCNTDLRKEFRTRNVLIFAFHCSFVFAEWKYLFCSLQPSCLVDLTFVTMLEQQKDGTEKQLLLFGCRLRWHLSVWDCYQPLLEEEEFEASKNSLTLVDISDQYYYITGNTVYQSDLYPLSQFLTVTSWYI